MEAGSHHSEESRRRMSESHIGKSSGKLGKHLSEETRKKMSEAHKGICSWNEGLTKETNSSLKRMSESRIGEKNWMWKHGYYAYHEKAWKLFGKDNCEMCGKSNEQEMQEMKKRLTMHCTSVPKDYTIMTPENWSCFCQSCHKKID